MSWIRNHWSKREMRIDDDYIIGKTDPTLIQQTRQELHRIGFTFLLQADFFYGFNF